MKQINAEIIAVGTELLLGQIANTNAQWISQELSTYGVNVFYHGVVGDNLKRVADTFSQAKDRSDLVIVTGGLGPTEDDLTREAFQLVSKLDIMEHRPSLNKIEAYFQKQGMEMTPNNRKQSHVFTNANVLENKVGMAPGMIVSQQKQNWVFLPGVPKEMKQMMKDDVIPFIQEITENESIIESMVMRFIGIGEAKLEDEIIDIIQSQVNPTIAPLAQADGVVIRLTAKADSINTASNLLQDTKRKILERVGSHFVGINEETIDRKIISLLKEKGKTIAAAESLTGGKFTENLISVKGASTVCSGGIVCYNTNVKTDVLGVSAKTIAEEGTVSEACAIEMANKVRNLLNTNIGISFTGIAGPEPIENKPVGLVYIALCDENTQFVVEKCNFHGSREAIRRKAVLKGFELLLNYLK
ncbi:nicotinamide-nucleotide amidase [Oceanobacillus limi]|uniref:Putative competence-damage inducible protein n=1 Tax=Oceanobacillus limi TaxID=930131 RepID=A0A1H9Z883_9BACI|nr:competence/damage-inducible protein A [Oceanobacillus limi]SES77078.1 nicotinamide-nucleotide amidase [Oceanobacillus limi]